MEVRHGDRQRVGGVRLRALSQAEDDADHARDLRFLGASRAGDGLFHPRRRIFVGREAESRADEEPDAARVTELRRGLRVLREEERFDARLLWTMVLDDLDERALDRDQTIAERAIFARGDDAVRDVHEPRAFLANDAPPEEPRSGVEAEDRNQVSFAKSSSETSKSAYTFATSS